MSEPPPRSPASQPPPDPRVGTVLSDRYRVDKLLDRGAMGRVYVGEHVLMKKRVAIKLLHRELTTVPEFVARFEREAMAAANIASDHVVLATDFGKLPDGVVFLVLEFVEGKGLRDEIARGPLPPARALHIARQIAQALESAHSLGIVHRDLKPENVMLVERAGDPDYVKVLDFGIARVPIASATDEDGDPSSRPITKAGMVFGTPEYMPPEQALGQAVDHRADLYSLGVILFEMLAGVRPFVSSSQVGILGQQISNPAPTISARAPTAAVTPAIEQLVARLLEREAGARHGSAREVLGDIDGLLGYGAGRDRIPTLIDGTPSEGRAQPPRGTDDAHDDALPTRSFVRPTPAEQLDTWMNARRHLLPPKLRGLSVPLLVSIPLAVVALCGTLVVAGNDDTTEPGASAAPSAPPVPPSAVPVGPARATP
ncbi:MAG: serine/threonine protein kinase, partial [Deltaproteobacteria bacterium]|nr:serine/threonine protein kinase [Deltaproteobacteria bacterium]